MSSILAAGAKEDRVTFVALFSFVLVRIDLLQAMLGIRFETLLRHFRDGSKKKTEQIPACDAK